MPSAGNSKELTQQCGCAGRLEALELLLQAMAKPFVKCERSPPLHLAVCMGTLPDHRNFSLAACRLLCKAGADISRRCVFTFDNEVGVLSHLRLYWTMPYDVVQDYRMTFVAP